jgi:nucleotide-binding universal stress UspA family protein
MNFKSEFKPGAILCPIDFSDLSLLALKYAAAGARLYGAKLILMHGEVFDVPRYFSRSETDHLVMELSSAKNMIRMEMTGFAAKALGKAVEMIDMEFEVIESHPVEAVLQAIEKRSIELIVLGTHGLSGVKRLLLGSVTENVIQNSKVPVFTVRQKGHDFIDVNSADSVPRLERILCACEPNEYDRETLVHAVSISERFNARLTVLYCDESSKPENQSISMEEFVKWVNETVKSKSDMVPVIRKGNAADQIIIQAEGDKSDLVVIGAHHRSFHDAMILGKTTDLVVRHAPAPVLVIPGCKQ